MKKTQKGLAGRAEPRAPEGCNCLWYASSVDDDKFGMEPCVCGHPPEDHTFAGCEFGHPDDKPAARSAPRAPKRRKNSPA